MGEIILILVFTFNISDASFLTKVFFYCPGTVMLGLSGCADLTCKDSSCFFSVWLHIAVFVEKKTQKITS